jgi:hypothetical protein
MISFSHNRTYQDHYHPGRDMDFELIETNSEKEPKIFQSENESKAIFTTEMETTIGSCEREENEKLILTQVDGSGHSPDHQDNSGEIASAMASSHVTKLQRDHVERFEIVEMSEVRTPSTPGKIEERMKSIGNVEGEDDDLHQDIVRKETPDEQEQEQEGAVNLEVEKKKKKSKSKKTGKSGNHLELVSKESDNGERHETVVTDVSLATCISDQKKLLEDRIAKERKDKVEARRQLEEVRKLERFFCHNDKNSVAFCNVPINNIFINFIPAET